MVFTDSSSTGGFVGQTAEPPKTHRLRRIGNSGPEIPEFCVVRSHRMTGDASPGWEFAIDGYDAEFQRVRGALFALAGAGLGTSGGPLLFSTPTPRWLVATGVYDGDGPETELLTGPVFSGLEVGPVDSSLRRALDLYTGVQRERGDLDGAPVEMQRFVSLARPGIVAVRTWFPSAVTRGAVSLVAPAGRDFEE